MSRFVPDAEGLEDRVSLSGPDVPNVPDTVVATDSPQPPSATDQDQGFAPGLGGAAGGSGDRGSPPGGVCD